MKLIGPQYTYNVQLWCQLLGGGSTEEMGNAWKRKLLQVLVSRLGNRKTTRTLSIVRVLYGSDMERLNGSDSHPARKRVLSLKPK